jgi:predicted nuclease with TOPRIM domain
MNGQELIDWRENLKTDLTEVKTDVKWIKENLGRMDVRQSSLEKQVSWLRGLGSVVGVILGSVLALVSSVVFGK